MGKRAAEVELFVGNMNPIQREEKPSMQREESPVMTTGLPSATVNRELRGDRSLPMLMSLDDDVMAVFAN